MGNKGQGNDPTQAATDKVPRDDFPSGTKDILARRVGMKCSNCNKATSGPQANPSKALNIGVAAHITAAAPGGPRYDPSLSALERSGIENGIWLCQDCAKLIDNDVRRYTVHINIFARIAIRQ